MNGFAARCRLMAAGLLALSLHIILLSQPLEYKNTPPRVIQEYRKITISLNATPPTTKKNIKQITKINKEPIPQAKPSPKQEAPPAPVKLPPTQPAIKAIATKKNIPPIKKKSLQGEESTPTTHTPKPQISSRKSSRKKKTVKRQSTAVQKEYIHKPETAPTIRKAAPIYQSNHPPKYPHLARVRSYEGVVIIEVLVDIIGRATKVRISTSSGHRILDKAALKAVRRWLFTPGSIASKPEEMWVKVPVRFRLE